MPPHGPMSCRACFPDSSDAVIHGPWMLINDPGYWGAADPLVLVLGFSKGNTQRRAYQMGEFDKVAFAKSRDRLRNVLARIGLLPADDDIDLRMMATERVFAFASLLRCSLSKGHKTSGSITVEAISGPPARQWIETCAQTHLGGLTSRTKLVVLLGLTDRYVEAVHGLLARLHDSEYQRTSATTGRSKDRTYVFVQHPSRLSENHYQAWLSHKSSKKRDAAIAAVNSSGVLPLLATCE